MPNKPPVTKTEFERLITAGVVKVKLTPEQEKRYENTLYRQHRVDMGHFYRCVCKAQFNADYQVYIKKLEEKKSKAQKKNKPAPKKRGRPPKDETEKLDCVIKAPFTNVDYLKILHCAEKLNYDSVAAFVRETLNNRVATSLYDERTNRRQKRTHGVRF